MPKSIKLKDNTYWDSSSIIYKKSVNLEDMLSGRWIANIDTHYLTGFYSCNPNTQGTFPCDNKYGQLVTSVNSENIYGEGFDMFTQIFIPTWGNELFVRTCTNKSNWTNWRSINNDLNDTGWIKLNLINGATNFTNGRDLAYRKIGKIVYLSGLFTAPATNEVLPIAYLPVGFRPHYDYESFIIRNGAGYCKAGINRDNGDGAIWIQGATAGETSFSNISFIADR